MADFAPEIKAGRPVLGADSDWQAWEALATPGHAAAAVVPRGRAVTCHDADLADLIRVDPRRSA
jgi:hypothetical protein